MSIIIPHNWSINIKMPEYTSPFDHNSTDIKYEVKLFERSRAPWTGR